MEPVACVRKKSEMLQLFPAYLKGEDLFGLTVSAVARIAESVSGLVMGLSSNPACSRCEYGSPPTLLDMELECGWSVGKLITNKCLRGAAVYPCG